MSSLDPDKDCVENTSKSNRDHADKGWPFELIWTRENDGGDIRADLKQVLPRSLRRGERAPGLSFNTLHISMEVSISSFTGICIIHCKRLTS